MCCNLLIPRIERLVGANYPEFSEDLKHFFSDCYIRFNVKFSIDNALPFICTRWTPSLFYKVIRANDIEFVTLLLDLGVSPNVCYPMFGLPLMWALSASTEMVELLLSYGADPMLQNDGAVCKFHN